MEITSRDRAGAYAEGAAVGAPNAVQVADRLHLLRNPTGSMERALERLRRAVHAVVPPLERSASMPSRARPVSRYSLEPRASDRKNALTRTRRLARYEQVLALWRQELSWPSSATPA